MDLLKVAVVILFVLLTIFTVKIHPEMHQPMIIEDAGFTLTRISDTVMNERTSAPTVNPKDVKIIQQESPKTDTKQIKIAENPIKQKIEIQQQNPIRQQIPKEQKKIVHQDTSQLELLQRIIKNTEQNNKPVEKPVENKPTRVEKPVQIQPKTVQQPKTTTHKNPYMTEQEEIIAWNKWRSSLQNRIMRDSQIDYAPLGTAFMFTFIVDKFGNVSNIKVECSNPNYANIARNNVKPAISALQRKPILNFPRGTQRTSTVVTGIFLIGTQERYSTPDDFSDFERITY